MPFLRHEGDRALHDFVMDVVQGFRIYKWRRGVAAHAAGVGAGVAVKGALVVAGRGER